MSYAQRTPSAQCRTTEGTPLPLQGVQAHGRVVGRMLEMTVEQRFRNAERVNVEVVYTFPLPWQAVLLGLEVELNGETLTGQVKAKAQARTDYEDALADGHTGVLLTVNPDGTHTLELGNLLAEETCVVRLRYVQVLQPEQGSLRLLLPATLAPRYGDPVHDGGYEPHAVPEVDPTVEYPFDIRLDIEGELAQATIGSPTHPVTLRTLPAVGGIGGIDGGTDGKASLVQVALGRQAWLDRDFVLVFDGLAHPSQGLAAWDRLDPGLGVVMASFTPALPTCVSHPVAMKVLVDCSGSMAGDSIQAARSALQRILEGLRPEDRFSLSRFGNTTEHRSKALWKVTSATLASARRWVDGLDADLGGTEMRAAILSTLELGASTNPATSGAKTADTTDASGTAQTLQTPPARADLLLVTDGEIHAIDDVLEAARRTQHRFFIVGIGASVAEGLLRRLADTTGGSCEFVAPGEAVEPAIVRLYHRMRSAPVLHARIEWPAGCSVEAASDLPRSIFAGDDVTVFARLRAPNAQALCAPVRLYGRTFGVEGEILLAELQPHFIADEPNTLARLATHQRDRQLRQAGHDAPAELRQQLPMLAEKYQLVTDDTSLVLVKERAPGERAQDMPERRPVKGMLAAGWGGQGSVKFGQDKPRVYYSIVPGSGPAGMRVGIDLPVPRVLRRSTANRVKELRAVLDGLMGHGPMSGPAASQETEQPVIQSPEDKPEFWTAVDADTSGATWAAHEGLTPAGFLEWLRLNPKAIPTTYEALRQTGLPVAVVEWLEFVVGERWPEEEVVTAFVEVMVAQSFTFVQSVAGALGRLPRPAKPVSDEVLQALRSALASMTATQWPEHVLDCHELEQEN